MHLQSRIVVGSWFPRVPIGRRRARLEVLAALEAVALRHLAAHVRELTVARQLYEDSSANSNGVEPLYGGLFGQGQERSINRGPEDAQLAWWMANATTKPSVVAIPTSLPPCSKASGIIVSASIARIPPAANVSTKATEFADASWKRL